MYWSVHFSFSDKWHALNHIIIQLILCQNDNKIWIIFMELLFTTICITSFYPECRKYLRTQQTMWLIKKLHKNVKSRKKHVFFCNFHQNKEWLHIDIRFFITRWFKWAQLGLKKGKQCFSLLVSKLLKICLIDWKLLTFVTLRWLEQPYW